MRWHFWGTLFPLVPGGRLPALGAAKGHVRFFRLGDHATILWKHEPHTRRARWLPDLRPTDHTEVEAKFKIVWRESDGRHKASKYVTSNPKHSSHLVLRDVVFLISTKTQHTITSRNNADIDVLWKNKMHCILDHEVSEPVMRRVMRC